MYVLIDEMFPLSSLISFSRDEISGGEFEDALTKTPDPSVVSEPPSFAPVGAAATGREKKLVK